MKWEYVIIDKSHDFKGLGEIGYELVAIDEKRAYFKRPVIIRGISIEEWTSLTNEQKEDYIISNERNIEKLSWRKD